MRRLALTLTLLLAAAMMAGMGATAQAAARPELRFPFDHHTCFQGPLGPHHTKPGGTCWAGGICLDPKDAHFITGDNGVWCLGKASRSGIHITVIENRATKDHNYFVVDLVGYVTYDPGNPIPGHAFWPFRDPKIDHALDHAPVVNVVFVPRGHVTAEAARNCVTDGSIDKNLPASYGRCSQERQFGSDHHTSYFVWLGPYHRFDAVHLINANGGGHQHPTIFCLFANDPSVGGSDVDLLPAQAVPVLQVFQLWGERHIAT